MARLLKFYIYIYIISQGQISVLFSYKAKKVQSILLVLFHLLKLKYIMTLNKRVHPLDLFQTHEPQWLILALSGLSWLCDCPTKTNLSC